MMRMLQGLPIPGSVAMPGATVKSGGLFLIEGGLYSVTALRETWARRRCILNTRNYHKQARCLADFLIVGGLYSVTALRKLMLSGLGFLPLSQINHFYGGILGPHKTRLRLEACFLLR
jgi:hypothetical protein